MKSIIFILIYVGAFIGFFLTLSLIGILWSNYKLVISDPNWFVGYSIFIGWWISILPAREYYKLHEDYFDDTF